MGKGFHGLLVQGTGQSHRQFHRGAVVPQIQHAVMGMNVSGGDSQHNRGNTLSRKMQGCRIRSAGTTHRQLEWDARIQSRFSARAASRGLVMAVGSNSLICTPPPKAPWESVTANPGCRLPAALPEQSRNPVAWRRRPSWRPACPPPPEPSRRQSGCWDALPGIIS